LALFLSQFPGFSALPSEFQGVLRISTTSPNGISVVGLRGRYNERRDFLLATTTALNERLTIPQGGTLFPYIAEGGGYTTQFILSSAGGQTSSGWLRFYDLSGLPLNLSLKCTTLTSNPKQGELQPVQSDSCLLSTDLDLGDSKRGAFANHSEYELLHYERRIRQWRKPRGLDRRRRDLSEARNIGRSGKQNPARNHE